MLSSVHKKINNLLSDKKFSEILTGSAFALVARVLGTGMALLSSVFVARIYGAEMMGVLAIVQAFMMMASIIAVMGTNVSILRLIPEHLAKYSVSSAFHVYRKTQYLVGFISVFVGGMLFCFSDLISSAVFSKPQFSFYIALTALFLIFRVLMDFNTQAVRGLRLIRTFAFMQVLPHTAMLTVLLFLMLLSHQKNDPVFAQLAAWGLTALVGVLIMYRAFYQRMQAGDVVSLLPVRRVIAISSPMLMTASMNFMIGQIGVLILGMYRPANEVGYYAVAVKLATLTTFVLQAINSMAAPKFSELYHTDQLGELFRIAKKSTKLIFWTTVPILLFLVILGRPVLCLFGEGFEVAYLPMLILVVGQFVNSVSGATGYFMNMTGNQKKLRNILLVTSSCNFFLSIFLIPRYGLYGAAVTGSLCLALWNVWTLIYIKNKYNNSIAYMPLLGC